MASPDLASVFDLYVRAVPAGVLDYLQSEIGLRLRRRVYSPAVVLWLMIVQRLQANGTLSSGVQELLSGRVERLLMNCKRVRQASLSPHTGAYSQARSQLPLKLVNRFSQEMLERLGAELRQPLPGVNGPVLLLDGSSIQLEHFKELLQAYPPPSNQHGQSHWPVMRLVVLHDLSTGLARCPVWGPMNGDQAVSEQALAERALERVEPGTVLMGDRNFGVFSTGWSAARRGLPVLLRLTEARAKKLAGPISQAGEYTVAWRPSRWDRCKTGQPWPEDAAIAGRIIAWRIGRGRSKSWLYLFTTVSAGAAELVELYGKRWQIEGDLRSLKRTVRLHHINVKSAEMVEKELLIAMAAYNLVRTVMCLAARQAQIDPRQLSFAEVLNLVQSAWPKLVQARTTEEENREFQKVIRIAARCTLPKRKRHRSYPRTVWPRGFQYPTRSQNEN
jgi:putative transposase